MTKLAAVLWALFQMILFSDQASAYSEDNRNGLWTVVRGCVFVHSLLGLPVICTEVDAASNNGIGVVLIKSPRFRTEFLVTPAVRVDGAERTTAQSQEAAQLWMLAWKAGARIEDILGRPVEIGLVVNSKTTRTQDQFHIHVDCVRASVQRALVEKAPKDASGWLRFPSMLRGHPYWLKVIESSALGIDNVLRLVATEVPGAYGQMERANVAVIGATLADGRSGFYLLANFDDVAAESLLDHSCRQ